MAATAIPDRPPVVEDRKADCYLFRCVCCWSAYCRPHIPRFAPGRDYLRVPSDAAAADDRPLWSVLVGCISIQEPFHNLRLHRFRVAASGRITGHTDDTLQPLLTVSPDDEENFYVSYATAALAPDGRRRLYGLCVHSPGVNGAIAGGPPPDHAALLRGFAVDLDTNKSLSPLPPLPRSRGTHVTVSARGKLWAPSVVAGSKGDCRGMMRLVVLRLDDGEAAWEEVAGVDILYQAMVNSQLSGYYLQGYAVIRDRFMLLSLIDSTFFSFDCTAGTLTPVSTTAAGESRYILPISGKAVHLGGDDDDGGMVYFIRGTKLFAYEFSPEEGKLLAPVMEVDRLWPYYEEGTGSVVHLTGRMLCAVWINMHEPCGCAERHALITTFLVEGGGHDGDGGGSFVPSGVHVLHSTCRRVGMLRSRAVPRCESFDYFCFLQEYQDHSEMLDPSMPVSSTMGRYNFLQADEETLEEDDDDDDMPVCCRRFLSRGVPKLKDCKSATRPDFYFICQVTDRSVVYHISTIGGKLTCHDKLLEPLLSLDTVMPGVCEVDEPRPSWHFVHQGSKLYVIPSIPGENHYEVDASSKLCKLIEQERPAGVCFSVVSRAGQHIVALGETLQDVYVLDEPNFKWIPMEISSTSSANLSREINISGFVDLIDDMFLVSDADAAECFLLDLRKREWFAVKSPLQNVGGILCGKCLFAEGFIFACTDIGLSAFELLKEEGSYCLGYPFLQEFPYVHLVERKLVCFDSICREDNSSSLVLCLVKGCVVTAPFTSHHRLTTTTVEVKLKERATEGKCPLGSITSIFQIPPLIRKDGSGVLDQLCLLTMALFSWWKNLPFQHFELL